MYYILLLLLLLLLSLLYIIKYIDYHKLVSNLYTYKTCQIRTDFRLIKIQDEQKSNKSNICIFTISI